MMKNTTVKIFMVATYVILIVTLYILLFRDMNNTIDMFQSSTAISARSNSQSSNSQSSNAQSSNAQSSNAQSSNAQSSNAQSSDARPTTTYSDKIEPSTQEIDARVADMKHTLEVKNNELASWAVTVFN